MKSEEKILIVLVCLALCIITLIHGHRLGYNVGYKIGQLDYQSGIVEWAFIDGNIYHIPER